MVTRDEKTFKRLYKNYNPNDFPEICRPGVLAVLARSAALNNASELQKIMRGPMKIFADDIEKLRDSSETDPVKLANSIGFVSAFISSTEILPSHQELLKELLSDKNIKVRAAMVMALMELSPDFCLLYVREVLANEEEPALFFNALIILEKSLKGNPQKLRATLIALRKNGGFKISEKDAADCFANAISSI